MWDWLGIWVMGRGWKNFETHGRNGLDCLKETVTRNMATKGDSTECSDGN